jgi:hypothetical protein
LVPAREKPPPWLGAALDGITGCIALFWRERQNAPSRKTLAATLGRLRDDLATLERHCEGSRTLTAMMLGNLFPDPQWSVMVARLAVTLSKAGPGDALDHFGWPSPKLLVACAVIALYRAVEDTPLNPKNKFALALCAAFLWRARELAGDPAPAMDARASQWTGSLAKARRGYGDAPLVSPQEANWLNYGAFKAAQRNSPLITARKFVDLAIEHARQQTHQG